MSIYSSTMGGQCSGPNQSPINLSQSTSEPCDMLCDLVFDDAYISQATVIVSDEGLLLRNDAGLGSCKFNGEGYTCRILVVNHPSHHTIENIQADGEVIAIFDKPDGEILCVSSLFRVNPQQTPSSHFFNAFIPYANPTAGETQVSLGEQWGLFMMVPPAGAYFVYNGTVPAPPCKSCTWVVFKSMINIDGNDFAMLAKNIAAGSRPLQDLGNRTVYFNDAEQLSGGPMPRDGKVYIRFKKVGKKQPSSKPVKEAGLKENKPSRKWAIHQWASQQIETNGFISLIDAAILLISIGMGLYFGYQNKNWVGGSFFILLAQSLASKIHTLLFGIIDWIRSKL